MKKIFQASIFSGLLIFVWMFISWAVLPWHGDAFKNLPAGDSLAVQIKAAVKQPGIYRYPGVPAKTTPEAVNEIMKKYESGPVIPFMIYEPNGISTASPLKLIWGLVINLISAFIASFLLAYSLFRQKSFWVRVAFVLLLAVFAALLGPLIDWNWLMFPADYSFGLAADYLVTWLLGGIVIALIIKPVTEKTKTAS